MWLCDVIRWVEAFELKLVKVHQDLRLNLYCMAEITLLETFLFLTKVFQQF